MLDRLTRLGLAALAGSAMLALGGCASDDGPELPKLGELNPFKEKQTPLPGRRIALGQEQPRIPAEMAQADIPISLPPASANDSWTQPGGIANNAPGNLAVGTALKTAWSASAGTGSSNKGRVISIPVVADGRVFTLDADGRVTAFNTASGSALWNASLTPEGKPKGFGLSSLMGGDDSKGAGFGGGLAIDGGRLFAVSGYGIVAAIDPATGKRIWEKNIGSPVRTSPTASGDRVFVISTQGNLHCFNGADGTEMWEFHNLPQTAMLLNNSSPAVDGDVVVAPFTTGEITAVRISDGKTLWSDSLTRTKLSTGINSLTDAARPAIADGVVYAVGNGGKMIATNIKTGERMWSAAIAGIQTPWVAGGTVYVVDTGGQLYALARTDGKAQWVVQMPAGKTWAGPIMAGNYLWLVNDKGQLVAVDPTTGKSASSVDLGATVFIAPVVASGKMFVMTDKASLIALN